MLKGDVGTQTIGLLICKNKDNVLAQYVADASMKPIVPSDL